MGVPKFYRWISERYPQINQMISGSNILPEFDNFYLDMNGIIHACTHPNDNQTANSLTLREMILAIFRYIDRMVTEIVKPKKILFMAIDGVAPRAKLNQQRARRFRAAQDREESIVKARQRGETVDEEAMFDSNCITPGTEFMEIVGKHLRWFIRKKVKEDPLWRNLRIVFSGHDVPGEGEHKIMQFIRDLRDDPHYEPNQRHCMYGQDADLIMLGLASHEPHFALLREVVDFSGGRPAAGGKATVIRQTKDAQFQLLHLSILREYLTLDFALDCTWNPDQERLIDDFIFLTFLVGNDFLPHLPTLDIGEHAFDLLISSYRQLMNASPGYIVLNGDIGDLARLEQLFQIIGQQENQILVARAEEVKTTNKKRRKYKDQVVASDEELEEAEDALQRAYDAAIQEAIGKAADPDADGEWTGVSRGKGEAKEGEDEDVDGDSEFGDEERVVTKDYRGRYYYEKFKVVPTTADGKALLDDVMAQYLKGLVWVLAYYVKGCISWTWYYPYHYGPMLQDMHGLEQMTTTFSFQLGQPFLPFQQLLGCLPPASTNLLPRLYQWLMVSNESPVRDFYPLEFGIDQDGKKNPWEAVVLLDFIDEVKLLQAEALHCPAEKLSQVERNRNVFGKVLTCLFEPGCTETYFSCNPEFGLPDIHCCNSAVSESTPSLSPGAFFKPELVPGTTYPIAGFPSLTVLPLVGCKVDAVKVNMFGSDSKYKSVVIELQCPQIDNLETLNAELLLGRIVYVNYPQVHEARVVAVTSEREEYRMERVKGLDGVEAVSVTHKRYDEMSTQRWKKESHEEETKYLKGRGTPGSGGLVVGEIKIRLRVVPLQGLQRDPVTGASKKIYATTSEADIPIQLALWTPPVHDTRFEECDELSVEALMPVGSNVLALSGQLLGCKGRVVGPHAAGDGSKSLLKTDTKRLKRVVDVEFNLPQPEPPFGYSIASSVVEEFFSTKDLCASLQVSPSVLGKLVGSIKLDVNRADIGLSLKRNGQYQLLGFAHRIEPGEAGAHNQRKVWTGADTIQIVGTVTDGADMNAASEADGCYWEYSVRAATLIFDYKMRFPKLFHNLERLPHQSVYNADELLGGDGKTKTEEITSWLAAQAYFKMPRTAFSTTSLSRDAMSAVERAADVYTSLNATKGFTAHLVKGIALDSVYCDAHRSPNDVSLPYNVLEPRLGDRVVNLTTVGVPFGLRGTVVTIHSSTKYVEAIFDEEFIGGKGLQGNCSQFRGHLCPWSGLLLVSRPEEYKEFRKNRKAGSGGASVSHGGRSVGQSHSASQSSVVPSRIHKNDTPAEYLAPKHSQVNAVALLDSLKKHPAPPVVTGIVTNGGSKSVALMETLKKTSTSGHSVTGIVSNGGSKSVALMETLKKTSASGPAVTGIVSNGGSKSVALLETLKKPHTGAPHVTGIVSNGGSKSVALMETLKKGSHDSSAAHACAAPGIVSNGGSKSVALLKVLKDRSAENTSTNLIALLKQQLEVTDEDGMSSLDAQTAAVTLSNGTGRAALMQAAGFDSDADLTASLLPAADRSLLEHNPLMGVISYHAVETTTATHSEAKSATPSSAEPTKRIAINKEATQRVVKHQLNSNAPIVSDTQLRSKTTPAVANEANARSITQILQGAKKGTAPADLGAPSPLTVVHSSTEVPVKEAVKPKQSIAAILANAKKVLASKQSAATSEGSSAEPKLPVAENKPAAQVAEAEVHSISHILSKAKKHSELEQTPAPASATRSISSILSNAKRVPTSSETAEAAPQSSNIASILSLAKRVPAAVNVDEVGVAETVSAPVVEVKKKINSLVPTKVMLTKSAAPKYN